MLPHCLQNVSLIMISCLVLHTHTHTQYRIVIMTELVVPALQNVSLAMERVGWTTLDELCGVEDMPVFATQLVAIKSQLCQLAQSVVDARLLLNCPDWVQWYQLAAHYGVCYSSSTALAWAASTQLVIMVLCMVILTLRVAYYELPEVADEGSNDKCVSHWCCCVQLVEGEEEEEDEDDKIYDSDDENQSVHDSSGSEYFDEPEHDGNEEELYERTSSRY
jgi:hypothetical protein